MKNDRMYLIQIQECVQRIGEYTQNGKEHFLRTPLVQDGVVRNFEIIGETTKQLSQTLKDRYPDIPWKRVAGFRDVLIHDYMGIDLEEVWGIIEKSLSSLERQIRAILDSLTP
ncbi:MAG: DUF86 domain-containing protein [Deltaproteobacteria bacterium]|nr:DUF86 domain-containing protein [Deltaproteobacteria bacterium]